MARSRSIGDMIAQARELTDCVDDPHKSDEGALLIAASALAELWDRLIRADPLRVKQDTTVTVTDPTVRTYAVPADIHSIIAVDYERGTARYPVEPFNFHERQFGTLTTTTSSWGIPIARYRLTESGTDGTGAQLEFDANPGAGTYRVHYVPAAPVAVEETTVVDGVGGWEDWIVYELCEWMHGKEQTVNPDIARRRAQLEKRLDYMAANRDIGRAPQIQDTYSRQRGRGRRWLR